MALPRSLESRLYSFTATTACRCPARSRDGGLEFLLLGEQRPLEVQQIVHSGDHGARGAAGLDVGDRDVPDEEQGAFQVEVAVEVIRGHGREGGAVEAERLDDPAPHLGRRLVRPETPHARPPFPGQTRRSDPIEISSA
jgi:hypothetical protein